MYTVQWCNHEGVLCERRLERLTDARREAVDLSEKYNGIQILDQNGNVIITYYYIRYKIRFEKRRGAW